MSRLPLRLVASAGLLACASTGASALSLDVTVTNTQSAGGLYLTPFLSVFHDGTYDAFDAGSAPSAGVEAIAEDGDVSVEIAAIGTSDTRQVEVVANPGGFPGAPVLDPGESTTITVDVDPTKTQFFSFLSMVIPSNDNFIGNDNPLAYRLFDANGMPTALNLITVTADMVWDAGTEANNGFGAAFSSMGGTATETNEGISLQGDLSFLTSIATPPGVTVTSAPSGRETLATIAFAPTPTPVPLPAGLPLALVGLAALGLVARLQKPA
ncbi:MAG: spondin domain-containing protein [Pseudomonadota bacterium]